MANKIPQDLNNDISSIQEPERKVLVRSLVIAVVAMAGVIGVLFAMVVKGNSSEKGDKDNQIAELKTDLKESQRRERIKDSLYTNCLIEKVRGNDEFIQREKKYNSEIAKSLRRQDTMFNILK